MRSKCLGLLQPLKKLSSSSDCSPSSLPVSRQPIQSQFPQVLAYTFVFFLCFFLHILLTQLYHIVLSDLCCILYLLYVHSGHQIHDLKLFNLLTYERHKKGTVYSWPGLGNGLMKHINYTMHLLTLQMLVCMLAKQRVSLPCTNLEIDIGNGSRGT